VNVQTGAQKAPAAPPLPSQSHLTEADDSPPGVQALTDRITAGFTALSEVLQSLEAGNVQKKMYPLAKLAYAKVPTPCTRYYRGIIAAKLGHFAEAEQDLLAAYRERAEPHKWLRERVEHLVQLGKLTMPPFPNLPEAELAYNLAVIYSKTDRYREMVPWAERAIEDPEFRPGILPDLAMALYKLQDFPRALSTFEDAYAAAGTTEARGSAAFKAACCAARMRADANVAKWIHVAVNEGYDKRKILSDPDLAGYVEVPDIKKALT